MNNLLYGHLALSNKPLNSIILLIRIHAGFTIMTAGLDKLPLTDWMTEQVVSMGFPFPVFFAWVASFSEFAFGLLLVFGFLTRFSCLMLAVVMGVAAFGFQKVLPLVDMHIAQGYFWTFLLLMVTGAGKYALDHFIYQRILSGKKRLVYSFVPVLVVLVGYGLYLEYGVKQIPVEEPVALNSINVPGTFNNWNPASNEMTVHENNIYVLDLSFGRAQPIEFKFTVNKKWDLHLGEVDQDSKGFPIAGQAETNQDGQTENIKAYVPGAGIYRFILNSTDYTYSLDTLPSN